MSNLTNQILVQNVETIETIITHLSMEAFDAWLSDDNGYGIVSLDSDADGEYAFVALVAPIDGPDFMMDMDTGEMEPAEDLAPAAELDAKMDIMMEMDMNDVSQEDILAMLTPEAPVPAPVENIIPDTESTQPNTHSGDTMSQPTSTVTPTTVSYTHLTLPTKRIV